MSAQSMLGSSIFIGSTIGEGELVFSDGTVQTTAYNASTTNGETDLTVNNLTVTETATIETAYIGSDSSSSGLVVYGNVQQVLPDSGTCQYGANCINSSEYTGTGNSAFGQVCLNNIIND